MNYLGKSHILPWQSFQDQDDVSERGRRAIYFCLPVECFSRFLEGGRGPEFAASFAVPTYAKAMTVACKPERVAPSPVDGCIGTGFVGGRFRG